MSELHRDAETAAAPWVGTRPYGAADRASFYGRRGDARRLLYRVLASPLTLLYGQSGVGKSSLLRAALIPMLEEAHDGRVIFIDDYGSDDLVAHVREQLCVAAEAVGVNQPRRRDAGLVELMQRISLMVHGPVVLVLDQFERISLYADDQRRALARQLAAIVATASPDLCVVIAVREDHLPAMMALREAIPNLAEAALRVECPDADGLSEAIVEPARRLGWEVEPDLVDTLLADLADQDRLRWAVSSPASEPDLDSTRGQRLCRRWRHNWAVLRESLCPDAPVAAAVGKAGRQPVLAGDPRLTVLQLLCRSLWQEAVKRDGSTRILTLDLYRSMGDADGILRRVADEVLPRVLPLGLSAYRERIDAARVCEALSRRGSHDAPCSTVDFERSIARGMWVRRPQRAPTILPRILDDLVVSDVLEPMSGQEETGGQRFWAFTSETWRVLLVPNLEATFEQDMWVRRVAVMAVLIVLGGAVLVAGGYVLSQGAVGDEVDARLKATELHGDARPEESAVGDAVQDKLDSTELDDNPGPEELAAHGAAVDQLVGFKLNQTYLVDPWDKRRARNLKDALEQHADDDLVRYFIDSPLAPSMYNSMDVPTWSLVVPAEGEDAFDAQLFDQEWDRVAHCVSAYWGVPMPRQLRVERSQTAQGWEVRFLRTGGPLTWKHSPQLAENRVVVAHAPGSGRAADVFEVWSQEADFAQLPAEEAGAEGQWLVPAWSAPFWAHQGIALRAGEVVAAFDLAKAMLEEPDSPIWRDFDIELTDSRRTRDQWTMLVERFGGRLDTTREVVYRGFFTRETAQGSTYNVAPWLHRLANRGTPLTGFAQVISRVALDRELALDESQAMIAGRDWCPRPSQQAAPVRTDDKGGWWVPRAPPVGVDVTFSDQLDRAWSPGALNLGSETLDHQREFASQHRERNVEMAEELGLYLDRPRWHRQRDMPGLVFEGDHNALVLFAQGHHQQGAELKLDATTAGAQALAAAIFEQAEEHPAALVDLEWTRDLVENLGGKDLRCPGWLTEALGGDEAQCIPRLGMVLREVLQDKPKEGRSLRHPEWLVESLPFWTRSGDDFDPRVLGRKLRSLQKARQERASGKAGPMPPRVAAVDAGIARISRGELNGAAAAFAIPRGQQQAAQAYFAHAYAALALDRSRRRALDECGSKGGGRDLPTQTELHEVVNTILAGASRSPQDLELLRCRLDFLVDIPQGVRRTEAENKQLEAIEEALLTQRTASPAARQELGLAILDDLRPGETDRFEQARDAISAALAERPCAFRFGVQTQVQGYADGADDPNLKKLLGDFAGEVMDLACAGG